MENLNFNEDDEIKLKTQAELHRSVKLNINYGYTTLMRYCDISQNDSQFNKVLELLCNSDDDPFMTDENGINALDLAQKNNNPKICKILRFLYEYPNGKNEFGMTHLMLACNASTNDNQVTTVLQLLYEGANPFLIDRNGRNAMDLASVNNKWISSFLETRCILLKNSFDVQDDQGMTLLMIACKYSKNDLGLEVVLKLLDKGADPFIHNYEGKLAIHLALKNNNKKICAVLQSIEQ